MCRPPEVGGPGADELAEEGCLWHPDNLQEVVSQPQLLHLGLWDDLGLLPRDTLPANDCEPLSQNCIGNLPQSRQKSDRTFDEAKHRQEQGGHEQGIIK